MPGWVGGRVIILACQVIVKPKKRRRIPIRSSGKISGMGWGVGVWGKPVCASVFVCVPWCVCAHERERVCV